MANHSLHSANRFGQNAGLINEDNNLEHDLYSEENGLQNDGADSEYTCLQASDIIPSNTQTPLRVHVEHAVRDYFAALADEIPTGVYDLILKEVELPLLTVVLEKTRGNQTKCAQILGLNRGTLRKKLKLYNLM